MADERRLCKDCIYLNKDPSHKLDWQGMNFRVRSRVCTREFTLCSEERSVVGDCLPEGRFFVEKVEEINQPRLKVGVKNLRRKG